MVSDPTTPQPRLCEQPLDVEIPACPLPWGHEGPHTPAPSSVDDDLREQIADDLLRHVRATNPAGAALGHLLVNYREAADIALSVVSPLLAERDDEITRLRERGDREHREALRAIGALESTRRVRDEYQAERDEARAELMESVALLRWLHAEACWQRDEARQAIAAITTGGRPADTIPAPDDDTTAFLRARWERGRAHPRCTGISSDALAWYAAGAPHPTKGDFPSDPDDLAACWRTYTMAPLRLRLRMLPVLRLYSDWVAERYPEQVAALLVEFEPADPTDEQPEPASVPKPCTDPADEACVKPCQTCHCRAATGQQEPHPGGWRARVCFQPCVGCTCPIDGGPAVSGEGQ